MLSLLAEGIADLSGPAGDREVGGDDYIYNGDAEAWIRTANALRARFLNSLQQVAVLRSECNVVRHWVMRSAATMTTSR